MITTLRRPYYEMSDGMYGLKAAVDDLKDPELSRLVKELMDVQNRIYKAFEARYRWD